MTSSIRLSNSLHRRPSLAESIRSVASNLSIGSSSNKKKGIRRSSSYHSYTVYTQIMFPLILRDPEVFKKLLEVILETPSGKRSLSRLARTCRAFSEPTLDVLWRELDSLIPILGLFPPNLLKKPRKPGLGLSKTPSEGDWDKIIHYGGRVRKFKYDESANNVSASIFPILADSRPVEYILPNLQQLVWKVETPAGLDHSLLFLNPQLQNLSVEVVGGSRSQKLSTVLADATSRMNLRALSLVVHTTLPDSFVDVMSTQTGLRKLQLIAPGALSPSVGRLVAALPELKSLQLDLTARTLVAVEGFFDDLPRSGQSTPNSEGYTDSGVFSGEESEGRKSALKMNGDLKATNAFATMRQLHLTGDASHIVVFLKHFYGPLVQLDLVIDDPPQPSDWRELAQIISGHFGDSLQSLSVSATGTTRFNDLVRSTTRAEPPAGRLSLEHLGNLPALSHLDIDLPESIHFVDTDIVSLASSCPNLEEVKLCPLARFPVQTGPPKLTLEGLAPLLAACTRLHTISVVVNAKRGSTQVLSERSVSSNSLQRLHVGHSWIHDFIHVGILLSHLAPRLESLKWFHERNRPGFIEANSRGWEKVLDVLPHLQAVRLMERGAKPVTIVKHVAPPVIPTVEKAIQASVQTMNQGILVRPRVTERSIQAIALMSSQSVQARPEVISVSIDATSYTSDASVDASASVDGKSVSANPDADSTKENATGMLGRQNGVYAHFQIFTLPSLFGIFALAYYIFIGYPIAIPFRIMRAILPWLPLVGHRKQPPSSPSSRDEEISMESAQVRE